MEIYEEIHIESNNVLVSVKFYIFDKDEYVDFHKAFDSVRGKGLWQVMRQTANVVAYCIIKLFKLVSNHKTYRI